MDARRTVAKLLMRLTAYPRIHIGLADMGFASHRSFGGVGFSFDHSTTVIDFSFHEEFLISGADYLDRTALDDLHSILGRLQELSNVKPFRARIESHAPQHCGFGSKTSLALALIAGTNHLCGVGLSRREMQLLSGRGGASGVGIHAFFDGGVICDGGHKMYAAQQLLPSGAHSAKEVPPLLSRLEFPPHWQVVLILGGAPTLSGGDEIAFFRQNAPVDRRAAMETLVSLHHGVLPSFATADYSGLAFALAELHSGGFKKCELMRCDERTQRCLKVIASQGFPIGVSSVGLLLYVVVDKSNPNAVDHVEREAIAGGLTVLGTAHGRNAGYNISGFPE